MPLSHKHISLFCVAQVQAEKLSLQLPAISVFPVLFVTGINHISNNFYLLKNNIFFAIAWRRQGEKIGFQLGSGFSKLGSISAFQRTAPVWRESIRFSPVKWAVIFLLNTLVFKHGTYSIKILVHGNPTESLFSVGRWLNYKRQIT